MDHDKSIGITEMRKIVAAAEGHSVQLIPHCAYFGPGNLASIHIVASLATDTLLENIYANLEANPFGDAMLAKDGKVHVPQGPGLGVEPDMKAWSSRTGNELLAIDREGDVFHVFLRRQG